MASICLLFLVISSFGVSVAGYTAKEIEAQRGEWNINPNIQHHIQTDEGPERFFRFETPNGQLRREKRLEDGTIIGTEGWIDAQGYLRIKDYIADRGGYRILRFETLNVGKHGRRGNADIMGRNAPTKTGLLMKSQRIYNPLRKSPVPEYSENSIETNPMELHMSNPPSPNILNRCITSSTILSYPRADHYSTIIHKNRSNINSSSIQNHAQLMSPSKVSYKRSFQKSYPYTNQLAIGIRSPLSGGKTPLTLRGHNKRVTDFPFV